ncbi:hypothetical protein EDD36DRAFT_31466 [Exophiala viscosa]|uniref:C2H2-type domain-containing protein n=1 Tax=Exophiala viscosa TaxID=2486360 RepID=A0AAN6IKC7_9EURO|nr:hypothetical protein EDD36DRAFT_31466 [Exophiala viscosa]
MPRFNHLDTDHPVYGYYCVACDRSFNTLSGAENHCRHAQVHEGEWCERCGWLFGSSAARDAHVANASCHNICERCEIDYSDMDDLTEHREDVHHWCSQCGEEFYNDNNLQQV